jgi:hypothetical protein
MKNKWLLWGAVAVGAYLIYKKMSKPTDNGKELAPPPVSKPPVSRPPVEKPLPPRERPPVEYIK